jgi:hypothetical protein
MELLLRLVSAKKLIALANQAKQADQAKSSGQWQAPSAEGEQIIALTARVKVLQTSPRGATGISDSVLGAKDGEDPPSGSQDGTALSLEVIIEMTPYPRSTVYADATLGANDGTAPAQGAGGTVNDDQLQAINAAVAAALAKAQGIKLLVAAIVALTNKYDKTSAKCICSSRM